MNANLSTHRAVIVHRRPRLSRGRTTTVSYRVEGDGKYTPIVEHTDAATAEEIAAALSEARGVSVTDESAQSPTNAPTVGELERVAVWLGTTSAELYRLHQAGTGRNEPGPDAPSEIGYAYVLGRNDAGTR